MISSSFSNAFGLGGISSSNDEVVVSGWVLKLNDNYPSPPAGDAVNFILNESPATPVTTIPGG